MGIIDTLSAGFRRTARRLWLILLPALLDIAIWVGPRLSPGKLTRRVMLTLPDAPELGEQYTAAVELLRRWLTEAGASANLTAMLSMRLLGLPSLTETLTPSSLPPGIAQRSIEIPSWAALLAIMLTLSAVGLLMGCICLSFIAQDARNDEAGLVPLEQLSVAYALRVAGRSWLRLLTLVVAATVAIIVLVIGATVVAALLTVISTGLAQLTLSLFSWGFLSIATYGAVVFLFTSRAIILDDAGIARSIWNALNVVHRGFLRTIAFVLLFSVLQTGLLYIWRMLAVSPAGTLAGILGNAYVSTGLAMASFLFYRDGYAAWQKAKNEKRQA